jgi:sortase (surface protein transpeptidase)
MLGVVATVWLAFNPVWISGLPQAVQAAAPATIKVADNPPSQVHAAAPVVAPAPTARIEIPSIDVNAPLTPVGLVNGALGTARTLWQVGEYTGGVVPGQPGLAILVGHSGAPGQWGVFENLSELKVGQTLKVVTASGASTSFVVTSSAAYPANATGANALFGPASGSVLRLVSCYGHWNASTQEYDQRWIVSTVKT